MMIKVPGALSRPPSRPSQRPLELPRPVTPATLASLGLSESSRICAVCPTSTTRSPTFQAFAVVRRGRRRFSCRTLDPVWRLAELAVDQQSALRR